MRPMSDSHLFLDSNVCLYLLGEDSPKKFTAEKLLALPKVVISTQVIGENINVAIKKFKFSEEKILNHINFMLRSCDVVDISVGLQKKAIETHFRYHFSFYDSLIIASALSANCTTLYTEDMQHGLVVEDKLTIINPFLIA